MLNMQYVEHEQNIYENKDAGVQSVQTYLVPGVWVLAYLGLLKQDVHTLYANENLAEEQTCPSPFHPLHLYLYDTKTKICVLVRLFTGCAPVI